MKIVALAGGVGGAKLAYGLALVLPPEDLTIIVNTGDDFEHLGLMICPDLDTVCYTLAGLANPVTGWGRAAETWHAFDALKSLGLPTWFRLGDQDLATHIARTERLHNGIPLSKVVRDFCDAWGVEPTVLPMSDQAVRTIVESNEGNLAFQDYFVRRHCEPQVRGFHFEGVDSALPAPGVIEALIASDAVVICPSNPWVSIAPILAITKIRQQMKQSEMPQGKLHPVIAVSPIVGGQAIKGPAAKMYSEMGIQPSAEAVAEHYRDVVTGFVLDEMDSQFVPEIRRLNMQVLITQTVMTSSEDKRRLAQDVLNFVGTCRQ